MVCGPILRALPHGCIEALVLFTLRQSMVLDALGSLTAHLLHWIEDPLGFVAGRQGVQDPQVVLMIIEDTIVSEVLHNQLAQRNSLLTDHH